MAATLLNGRDRAKCQRHYPLLRVSDRPAAGRSNAVLRAEFQGAVAIDLPASSAIMRA
jgi:hypothetical protein